MSNLKMSMPLFVAASLLRGLEAADALVVEVDISHAWFHQDGRQLAEHLVRCNVSIKGRTFFIRPYLIHGSSQLLLQSLGTSPYSSTNFVTAFPSPSDSSGRFQNVVVDNHPAEKLEGLFAQLARIAYVDPTSIDGPFAERDFYFLPFETASYSPHEIAFDIKYSEESGHKLLLQVVAISPSYYYTGAEDRKGRTRISLQDAPNTRVLWQFSVKARTNINGRSFPASFSYVRFIDVDQRAIAEDLVPIVQCEGKLISINNEGEESLADFLEPQLTVFDARPRRTLYDRPMVYKVTNGIWLDERSPEFARLVAFTKARLKKDLALERSPPISRPVLFALLLVLGLIPVAGVCLKRAARQRSLNRKTVQ